MPEKTIDELQQMMAQDELTSQALTEGYLRRIAELDQAGPNLRAVIEVNPDAVDIAAALDAERRGAGPARTAARHSHPDQGQHRHGRPHADHGRLAGAGRRSRAPGRDAGERAARRRAR